MWGISGVYGQYLFEHTQIDSTWLIAVRQILAGLMYMMVIVKGERNRYLLFFALSGKPFGKCSFTLGLLGSQYGFYYAIKLSNAPTATVLIYTAPVFVVLQQVLMQHRPVEKKRKPWESLRLLWVSFLFPPMATRLALSFRRLLFLVHFLSAIAMTLYTVAPAHILKEYSSPYLMGWGQLLSGFILLPLCNPFHSGVESWTFF